MKPLCIYHKNCIDGFMAATIVRMAYRNMDGVDFHPGVYGDPPPDVTGRSEVILVDFSYKRRVLLEMAKQAEHVLILDHHKTAMLELIDLPDNVEAHFDMDRCGAMMAWNHFFPNREIPRVLMHIQDRDLWRFELDGTANITSAIYALPQEFEFYETLLETDPVDELRARGVIINQYRDKLIRELIKNNAYRMELAGYNVPALNCPGFLVSDVANIMAEGEPFAVCYFDVPGGTVFSLRSSKDGIDVSEVAQRFGGGGHKHAAGFKLTPDDSAHLKAQILANAQVAVVDG